jgi:uncharacterized heparinase superfamily protein
MRARLKRLALLYASIRHSRWSQLRARALLMAKRKSSVWLNRLGLRAGGWYRAAPCPWGGGCSAARAGADYDAARASLPIQVDLVGTPWTVELGMDWHPAALERGTRLEKLNLHYMDYVRHLKRADAAAVMVDWIEENRPFEREYWKASWNSYSLSIRVVNWLDVLEAGRDLLDEGVRRRIDQSICAQMRFLVSNVELDIGGNHLVKNLRCLLRAGADYEGPEADRWIGVALHLLGVQLAEQVLPDGMHFELSPSYHLQVGWDLLDMLKSLDRVSGSRARAERVHAARSTLRSCIQQMLVVAGRLTHPDGGPSLFGDGGMTMVGAAGELARAAAAAGVRSPRATAPGQDREVWRLPDAGYVGLTSASEVCVVDCGAVGARHLPAHGHGDALALEWSVRSQRVFVDAGTFEYHAGSKRDRDRSTRSHNTVTLDGQDQSEFWSAFRVGRRAEVQVEKWLPAADGFTLSAGHDGYATMEGAPRHRRTVIAGPGALVVEDSVDGGAGQAAHARLLLGPCVRASTPTKAEAGFEVNLTVAPEHEGASFCITVTSTAAMHLEDAVFVPDFGVEVPTKRIVIDMGAAPCAATWRAHLVREAD